MNAPFAAQNAEAAASHPYKSSKLIPCYQQYSRAPLISNRRGGLSFIYAPAPGPGLTPAGSFILLSCFPKKLLLIVFIIRLVCTYCFSS